MAKKDAVYSVDRDGNVIQKAFPVSRRTRNQRKRTSVGFTLISVLLHILAFVPIVAITLVLAIKCYNLMPYYTFWPFVAVIVAGLFGLIFMAVTLAVSRKKSRSSIAAQTVKIAITYVCLTSVFATILTYIVPDVISMATQGTLYVEDLYYNGESQAEANAKLERDFIMYNVLNGNLNDYTKENGNFAYTVLHARDKDTEQYDNAEIQSAYNSYMTKYKDVNAIDVAIKQIETNAPRKYELYDFIYNTYVLNDYDYAFYRGRERKAFALSVVDYVWKYSDYENLLKEGFKNKKLKQLFDTNFDSFNQDGYQPFDDPLLLYAQLSGRMTIPVVLRLILNEGWMYSQPSFDTEEKVYFDDDDLLYELYDIKTKEAFDKKVENGEAAYDQIGKLLDKDGKEYEVKYGYNEQGWLVYENGIVRRPMKWLVLDMLGSPMDVANVDIVGALGGIVGMIPNLPIEDVNELRPMLVELLQQLKGLVSAVGGLVQEDVTALIKDVTGGASLNLNLCIDDNGNLNISISPMNAQYGMLGYMQASWVQSDNLLMAVINVIGARNWFAIFGSIGVVLVIAAGICRIVGEKTRERTAIARDRIARSETVDKINSGELNPSAANRDDHDVIADMITVNDIGNIEKTQSDEDVKNAMEECNLGDVVPNEEVATESAAEEPEVAEQVSDEEEANVDNEVAEEPVVEENAEESHEEVAEPVAEESEVAETASDEESADTSNEVAEQVNVEETADETHEVAETASDEESANTDNEVAEENNEEVTEPVAEEPGVEENPEVAESVVDESANNEEAIENNEVVEEPHEEEVAEPANASNEVDETVNVAESADTNNEVAEQASDEESANADHEVAEEPANASNEEVEPVAEEIANTNEVSHESSNKSANVNHKSGNKHKKKR